MSRFKLSGLYTSPVTPQSTTPEACGCISPLRIAGLATLALGVLSLGLYAGRELRIRYKFRHRTPSDFFSRAGDLGTSEYGMGV